MFRAREARECRYAHVAAVRRHAAAVQCAASGRRGENTAI